MAFSHLRRAGIEGAITWGHTKKHTLRERHEAAMAAAHMPLPPPRKWAPPGRAFAALSPAGGGGGAAAADGVPLDTTPWIGFLPSPPSQGRAPTR